MSNIYRKFKPFFKNSRFSTDTDLIRKNLHDFTSTFAPTRIMSSDNFSYITASTNEEIGCPIVSLCPSVCPSTNLLLDDDFSSY